ncbi:MAG: cytochrome b [Gammaproteobacteria bacterium]|nr:cytochrome b [Gammaproteobacteria bacterium]
MLRNTSTAYGNVAKFFHWLIFVLLLVMIIYGYFLEDIPKVYKGMAINAHKLLGITILFLVLLRLIWALINPKPALPPDTKAWERALERLIHFSLYAAVIAMPLAGWVASAAGGHIPHIGDLYLNLPIEQNKALSESAFDLHKSLAIVIIVLFCIHVLAALYHHFILKDNVLRRMMP